MTPPLDQILDALESFYGRQAVLAPTDPYLFLLWWQCGYPPSEEHCARGFAALAAAIGTAPVTLRATSRARLTRVLKAGGLVPELRAQRLREVAATVEDEFDGDLPAALRQLPPAKALRLLKTFPGIGSPGADRILLFGGIGARAAVPSSCPYVLVRIESGREPEYRATYQRAQARLESLPETFAARMRAYLLLQRHGRELCKRTRPRCSECPLAQSCRFNRAGDRPRTSPRSHR